ncbi:MAG: alpha amylase, partial [Pseudolabrys sp.]
IYYGDELGIGRIAIPQHAVQDPWEKNEPGLGLGRDPSRTPFQWDATERIVICPNFGDGAQQVSVDDVDGASILVSTYPARTYLVRARMKA